MEWKKTSHCSWVSDQGHKIVKQYKPCKGGTIFCYMNGRKFEFAVTLEKAMKQIEVIHGEQNS